MESVIDTHRETALESPYSREREEAIAELNRLFSDGGCDDKQRILEIFRQVAHESSSRNERKLSRTTMKDCFENDTSAASAIAVNTFYNLATDLDFSEERWDTIDAIQQFYEASNEQQREKIGHTLADIARNATYEDERRRARNRLSDITRLERSGSIDASDTIGYLVESLAEHLEGFAHDWSEACLQRAAELEEFVNEHPLTDEAYQDVQDSLESLVEQLKVGLTGDA